MAHQQIEIRDWAMRQDHAGSTALARIMITVDSESFIWTDGERVEILDNEGEQIGSGPTIELALCDAIVREFNSLKSRFDEADGKIDALRSALRGIL